VRKLIEEFKPDAIFVAGDLSDPHGTHRMCKEAIDHAMAQLRSLVGGKGEAAQKVPETWLYRGAWQEWPITEATVLVPLSSEDQEVKHEAILKHQSQKDPPLFPGNDPREFHQRVRERNGNTAKEFDRLGVGKYHGMEAFVVIPGT
jgi:glucosamine-6-phosphate deaminase